VTVLDWLGVAVLGGLGALVRFLFDGAVSARTVGTGFPTGTLAVNVTGAFLLGLVTGLALTGNLLVLAGAATLGSYTTFSTWMLETHRLREEAQFLPAAVNAVLSILAGLGAVALGRAIGGAGP
jgi:CrcB protein